MTGINVRRAMPIKGDGAAQEVSTEGKAIDIPLLHKPKQRYVDEVRQGFSKASKACSGP